MKIKINDPKELGLNPHHFTEDNRIFEVDRITSNGDFVIQTPSEIYLGTGDFTILSNEATFDIEVWE